MNQKRQINWSAYNKQLVKRGFLNFLFSEDIAHNWYNCLSKRLWISKSLYRQSYRGFVSNPFSISFDIEGNSRVCRKPDTAHTRAFRP